MIPHALLALPAASVTPQYDEDGNLKSDGLWTYTWDAENRLIRCERDAALVTAGAPFLKLEYDYDSQSRRIRTSTFTSSGAGTPASQTLFVFDGWKCIAELDALAGNQPIRKYTWGLDLAGDSGDSSTGNVGALLWLVDTATNKTHVHLYDRNGNVSGLVDATTHKRSATYDYDAFGQLTVCYGDYSKKNPFGFSTKHTDFATGLCYYGYRWYSPFHGRWISRDPIEENGGINLNLLLNNNSINYIDYLGFCSSTCIGKIEVMFVRSYTMTHDNPNWKKVGDQWVVDDPNHYKVSGRQFAGFMNVFDECGHLMEAFDVISGGHKEPGRPPGHDTPTPSGKHTVDNKLVGSVPGYTVNNVPGRSYVQIHKNGTTTGCIATQFFDEQFVPLMKGTLKSCCKNRNRVPLEVWYNIKDGSAEPQGNTFNWGDGDDPGYKPEDINHVTPPPIPPKAIVVPDASNPKRPWWKF